jgi:hypothetical protein
VSLNLHPGLHPAARLAGSSRSGSRRAAPAARSAGAHIPYSACGARLEPAELTEEVAVRRALLIAGLCVGGLAATPGTASAATYNPRRRARRDPGDRRASRTRRRTSSACCTEASSMPSRRLGGASSPRREPYRRKQTLLVDALKAAGRTQRDRRSGAGGQRVAHHATLRLAARSDRRDTSATG